MSEPASHNDFASWELVLTTQAALLSCDSATSVWFLAPLELDRHLPLPDDGHAWAVRYYTRGAYVMSAKSSACHVRSTDCVVCPLCGRSCAYVQLPLHMECAHGGAAGDAGRLDFA